MANGRIFPHSAVEYFVFQHEKSQIGGMCGGTFRCCGNGSGESIGEKRVDEEVL